MYLYFERRFPAFHTLKSGGFHFLYGAGMELTCSIVTHNHKKVAKKFGGLPTYL